MFFDIPCVKLKANLGEGDQVIRLMLPLIYASG